MTGMDEVLAGTRLLPVVTPRCVPSTVALARALQAAGLGAIEITLRNDFALDAIKAVRDADVAIRLGAGTVTSPRLMRTLAAEGVDFAVSPGLTPRLLEAARETGLDYLPGVAAPSDVMLGAEWGLSRFKLFPASAINGAALLKALHAPFPGVLFCPTGGIDANSARNYLQLDNVFCVGGSWMIPADALARRDWPRVEAAGRESLALLERQSVSSAGGLVS